MATLDHLSGGRVVLGINGDGSRLQATVSVDFKETKHDWSQVTGEWTVPVGVEAEIVSYDDLIAAGSMAAAKSAGKVRIEGKDYVMADGDVVEFRFNV